MNPTERSQLRQVLHGRCDVIADGWYTAIAGTGFAPRNAVKVRQRLAELTEQVIALLLTEPFDYGRAQAIGASLAGLHDYIQPEALGRTQEALGRWLVKDLLADQVVALQPRLAALLGGLAVGFFQQARQRILAEQEQIRKALINERKRAEEALQKAHNELERRVEERTAELAKANEELQTEIAERKRAEAERERLLTALKHRNVQLQTAAEVSKSASTILDPEELMNQTVNLIQKHFNFYYVGIFLVDKASEYAVLRAGTGEAGRQMLEAGHRLIAGGESMIGWSVANAQARIALDTGKEAVRFDNPLLPETRSEMALPLISRGQCMGALTVQSTEEAAFSEQDIAVLQTMADHLAIAIGNARLYNAAQREITERKRVEEQLQTSLREKEVLLKEIHHRVKNNLQVVSSLLKLQSEQVRDKQTFEMFRESQNRVKSMALFHENLYQSRDLAKIDFAEYIQRIAAYLFRSYGVNPDAVTLKIDIEGASVGIDTAMLCGVIINELVSNSLKHAFPTLTGQAGKARGERSESKGEIRIALCSDRNNQFTLIVSDNGVGLPKDLDFRNTKSLGLQLVNMLTRQLEGTIELDRSDGTAFKITFAKLEEGKEII